MLWQRVGWVNGDFEKRQEVQKMAFPEGIYWNREKGNYQTVTKTRK